MKILLINHNPVVSRLTSLSAKKEKVELDEIKEISELTQSDYRVVFVDSESYNEGITHLLQNADIQTKVLFYTQGDNEDQSLFDHAILKPFLPSEVSAILRESKIALQEAVATPKEEEEKSITFEELVENREPTLPEPTLEETNQEENNQQESKTEIKDDFDLKLEEAFPLHMEEEEEEETPTKEATNTEDKAPSPKEPLLDLEEPLFELDDNKEDQESTPEDLFELDKEIKEQIVGDDLLDLDLESQEEVSFDEKVAKSLEQEESIAQTQQNDSKEPAKEIPEDTKVLDQEEVSNIKNLLEDENHLTDENLTLDDIITPTAPSLVVEEKPKPNPKEEENPSPQAPKESSTSSEETTPLTPEVKTLPSSAEVLTTTLSRLPTEELRKLLRGATVSITIQFPND